MYYLRGGQHVIRCRDSLAQFVIDEVEKVEHVGVLATSFVAVVVVTGVLMTPRLQAQEHDVPGHPYDLDFLGMIAVLEQVQYSSSLAGIRQRLVSPHPAYRAEMPFAGEDVIPVVHEGDATGVQVTIMLGRVVFASDVDPALAERVDDNGGLSAGPIFKVAVPEILFCHSGLPKLIIYPTCNGHWRPVRRSSMLAVGCAVYGEATVTV
jgi:hypothetical protein